MLDTQFNHADKGSYRLAPRALFMSSPSLLHLQGQALPWNNRPTCKRLVPQHRVAGITLFVTLLLCANCCHGTNALRNVFTSSELQTEEKVKLQYLG